jgi:phosphate transport system substrate-binding protein
MRLNQIFRSAAAAAIAVMALSSVQAADITGAGATFPYPVYAKWAEAYKKATGNGLNYQSIGSGGGIKQIKAKTVDFGASDMPLPVAELEKAGLMQFPAIMGGIVPVVNLEGVVPGQLKMTSDVLANIYLGKITKWNAPDIAGLNPGSFKAAASGADWAKTPRMSVVLTDQPGKITGRSQMLPSS